MFPNPIFCLCGEGAALLCHPDHQQEVSKDSTASADSPSGWAGTEGRLVIAQGGLPSLAFCPWCARVEGPHLAAACLLLSDFHSQLPQTRLQ